MASSSASAAGAGAASAAAAPPGRGPGRRWEYRDEDQIYNDFQHDADDIVSNAAKLKKYADRYSSPSDNTLKHRRALNKLLRNMARDPARVAAAQKGIVKKHLNGLIDDVINALPGDSSLNESLNSTPELNRSLGLNDSLGLNNDSLGLSDSRPPTPLSGTPSFYAAPAPEHSMVVPGLVSPVTIYQGGSADGGGAVKRRRASVGGAASGNQVNRVIQVLEALKIGISNWAGPGENVPAASIAAQKPGLHSRWPGTT